MNKNKGHIAVGILAMLIVMTFSSPFILSNNADAYVGSQAGPPNGDNVVAVTAGDIGIYDAPQYAPGSEKDFYAPIIITTEGAWVKNYWLTMDEPVKVHWDIYDPYMHKVWSTDKTPDYKRQGSFQSGGKTFNWICSDSIVFTVPAFPRTGQYAARCYFVDADGNKFGYGPLTLEETGDALMEGFTVTKGTLWDNVVSAPIYILGYKTIPLIWWLSPLWIFLIIFVILVIFSRSIGGAVLVLKGVRKSVREARAEWRKPS